MKSFKEYLNENELSPQAPRTPVPATIQSPGPSESCEEIRDMIDHYRAEVARAHKAYKKALQNYLDACGEQGVDRAVWCAKHCGGGGKWDGEWLEWECMERCLAVEDGRLCEWLLWELSDAFEEFELMELFLWGYLQDLANKCTESKPGEDVLKGTQNPDSKIPSVVSKPK